MCFLITQILLFENKETVIPMKFKKEDNRTYTYEWEIISDEIIELTIIQIKNLIWKLKQ